MHSISALRLSFFFLLVLAPVLWQAAEGSTNGASPSKPPTGLDEARSIIADVQKIVTPNGIEETLEVDLNGTRQVINIRGTDKKNPVLIYVHGGPGSVEMPMAWTFQRPWEDFFTVVQWDQRAAGRSYLLNDPSRIADSLTLETYRDDAISLIEYLRSRLGQEKVFLLGHSFGSAVGLSVAVKRPDLLHAYIGMGQLIDFRENERVGMKHTVEIARSKGDLAAVSAIEALHPYPDSGPFTIEKADAWRKFANSYGSLAGQRKDAKFYYDSTKLSPLYTQSDREAWFKGSAFTVTTLFPRLADVSFSSVHEIATPIVFLLGRLDSTTPSPIAASWLKQVNSPEKVLCWFENSGHLPMIEEPGKVLAALIPLSYAVERRNVGSKGDALGGQNCTVL